MEGLDYETKWERYRHQMAQQLRQLGDFAATRRASLESFLVCFRGHAAPFLGRASCSRRFGFDILASVVRLSHRWRGMHSSESLDTARNSLKLSTMERALSTVRA
jgi:hypothetical protein